MDHFSVFININTSFAIFQSTITTPNYIQLLVPPGASGTKSATTIKLALDQFMKPNIIRGYQ